MLRKPGKQLTLLRLLLVSLKTTTRYPPSRTIPSLDIDADTNDTHEPIEIEGAGPAEGHDCSGKQPEDPVNDDTLSSEEQSSADASSQNPVHGTINPIVEHPREAKSGKRQRSRAQVDESLVITRPKRVRAGPAPKEILMLAERAELAGDLAQVCAPKAPKRRVRKT